MRQKQMIARSSKMECLKSCCRTHSVIKKKLKDKRRIKYSKDKRRIKCASPRVYGETRGDIIYYYINIYILYKI